MSYGIIPYMVDMKKIEICWNSQIEVGKSNYQTEMKEKLGFSFLPKETATEYLKRFNRTIKKELGVPNFSAHVVAKDFFMGRISYPTIPFVYAYLLEGFAARISKIHYLEKRGEFKRDYAHLPYLDSDNYGLSEETQNFLFENTLQRKFFKTKGILPNDAWYPCDLDIINYLPGKLPIPIPEPEDFPFVSVIKNPELPTVFEGIPFEKFGEGAKQQMKLWFDTAGEQGLDLILFVS